MDRPVGIADTRITGPVWTHIRPDVSELEDALDRVSELVAEARRILDDLPGVGFVVEHD